jgi:hypothetical protein
VAKEVFRVAIFLVVVVVAVASAWFVLNQIFATDQTDAVRITGFSVDPAGWKSGESYWYGCPFDITFQNIGTNDAQRLWLKVRIYRLGEAVGRGKAGAGLVVPLELMGFNLSAGETRNFQGVMYWTPTDVNTGEGHPFGATYMAEVVFENSSKALDTVTVVEPFSILVVAGTLVTVIAIVIYFKKRKHQTK